MGVTYIHGQVKGPKGKQTDGKFLVDSGTTYSVLPKEVWERIGLKPKRKMQFTLVDGTPIERSISEVYVILPQGEAHTPVMLGEDGDQAVACLGRQGALLSWDRLEHLERPPDSRIQHGFESA